MPKKAADVQTSKAGSVDTLETPGRFETFIVSLPRNTGRARVTRNLDTGEQEMEVIERTARLTEVDCPHCGGVVSIREDYSDGRYE